MKKVLFLLLMSPFLYSCAVNYQYRDNALASTTKADTVAVKKLNTGLKLKKVKLTDQFTILYFSYFYHRYSSIMDLSYGVNRYQNLSINPKAKLVSMNGDKDFSFIKAKGIPTSPRSIVICDNGSTNFELYFQRLDPGIEIFNLFECNSDKYITCWNFQGITVSNPKQ